MTLSSSDEYHLKVCFIRIEEPSSPEMDVGGFEFYEFLLFHNNAFVVRKVEQADVKQLGGIFH